MVHFNTLFVISLIVYTVSGSINFAHSDSCSHERYDDDDYDDRDRGGGRFGIGNGECEIDDSDSRGDHSDSGYHGGHRPRPHPRPHPHPHRPPKPEHCPGTWTPWINVKGAMCNDTCGNCGLIDQYRICYPERCKCSGPTKRKAPCANRPCPFPRTTCCPGYNKKINYPLRIFYCG